MKKLLVVLALAATPLLASATWQARGVIVSQTPTYDRSKTQDGCYVGISIRPDLRIRPIVIYYKTFSVASCNPALLGKRVKAKGLIADRLCNVEVCTLQTTLYATEEDVRP